MIQSFVFQISLEVKCSLRIFKEETLSMKDYFCFVRIEWLDFFDLCTEEAI